MQRSKLGNLFLKNRNEKNRNNCVKLTNLCVALLRNSKTEFFLGLNKTGFCNNKNIWGVYKPLNSKLGLSFSFSQVEHDETMKEINDLKTSKAMQSTDIPAKLI